MNLNRELNNRKVETLLEELATNKRQFDIEFLTSNQLF
jgi:hypothetical protein